MVEFGLDIAQQRMEFGEVVWRSQLAEDLGFSGLWGFDHFRPMYGDGPGNCFEGMTTIAALTGRTNTIRLGLLVTGATWRHPSVFAAAAMTIDHASEGRLNVGLGTGWYEAEHVSLGVDFPSTPERFARLEDTLEVLTRLFTGEVVNYSGATVVLTDAQLLPVPRQDPRPPIWIGGSGRMRTLPLAARFADVWHTNGAANAVDLRAELDRLTERAGRDPAEIRQAGPLSLSGPMSEVRNALEDRIREGYDHMICGWPGEGAEQVESFVREVMVDYL